MPFGLSAFESCIRTRGVLVPLSPPPCSAAAAANGPPGIIASLMTRHQGCCCEGADGPLAAVEDEAPTTSAMRYVPCCRLIGRSRAFVFCEQKFEFGCSSSRWTIGCCCDEDSLLSIAEDDAPNKATLLIACSPSLE